MTNPTVEIYALIDPRDGSVRYIGKAVNSQKRLKGHLRETRRRNTPVYRWMAKLRGLGMAPVLSIQCVCGADEWQQKEREAIASVRACGNRLLNVADGGDEPSCPYEVRASNGRKVAVSRVDTPIKAKVYQLKKMMGDALRSKYLSQSSKIKLRGAAREAAMICPSLFGGWAAL